MFDRIRADIKAIKEHDPAARSSAVQVCIPLFTICSFSIPDSTPFSTIA